MIITKTFVSAILLLALGAAPRAEGVTIKAGVTPIIDQAQYYAAVQQGYFRDEGLNVETYAASPPALLPALTAGQVQMVPTGPIVSILQAVEQGIQLRIVGPGTAIAAPPPDISPIAVRVGGPVKTPKDLEGRALAVPNLNGNLWLYARAYLEKNGVDLSKVRFVEVPFPQQLDTLVSGRVDAAAMTEPFATSGLESGKTRVLGYPYTDTQANFVSVVLVTTADWSQNNPDAVRRFTRAYLRGQAYINERKKMPEGVKLISSYTKLDPKVVAKIAVPDFPPTVDRLAIEQTATLMVRYGLLKKMPDLGTIISIPQP